MCLHDAEFGAGRGSRTPMPLRALVLETSVSANSTTPANIVERPITQTPWRVVSRFERLACHSFHQSHGVPRA
jgi:hypothetical protein